MAGSDDDHSSINLSLRLRRGSSDSRDSFYMDFDKGIDSDIDIEPCTRDDRNDTLTSTEESEGEEEEEEELGPEQTTNWVGIQSTSSPTERQPAPSPTSPSHILATPEPTSLTSSSLAKLPNGSLDHGITSALIHERHHNTNGHFHKYCHSGSHFGSIEATPLPDTCPSARLSTPNTANQKLSQAEASDFFLLKKARIQQGPTYGESLILVLSAMYAKLLVVMGIGFPLAEVISPHISASFFVVFYLYLYIGSILFLIYAYTFLFRERSESSSPFNFFRKASQESLPGPGKSGSSSEINPKKKKVEEAGVHCGSFYLRMGAVAFGIGSMIYSGLEFGQFFELDPHSACYSMLIAITPITQMIFTFFQLYFIFLNSKMCIYKYMNLARFGLMHMVATNLCVWLHVLVQESKHEILTFLDLNPKSSPDYKEEEILPDILPQDYNISALNIFLSTVLPSGLNHHRSKRGLKDPMNSVDLECRRVNIMGQLVQDASPFLFPCTIEYSLICAAILYVMWKNIGKSAHMRHNSVSSDVSTITNRRHHYSVDCAHANKGLFTGILVLVLAIISLILFFVLINKPEFKELAVLEAHICELGLYSMCTLACIAALVQVRELRYNPQRYIELDNILLVVAQTGVYLFAVFCIIGGHFTIDSSTVLVLITALGNLVQATVQTIFILDASRRNAFNSDQAIRKPGREMITFLLVCNFAMWAINSLETRRADSNPVQLNFYGFWAWTIITHISSPLAIFFRFHSTVCLCEIWKKIYKMRPEQL